MHWLIEYALSFVGVPYKWGGSNPIEGMDCSGFVQEVLRSVGIDPPGDQTAQNLFNELEKTASYGIAGPGSIAFYGDSVTKITHVAFCIDCYRVIEAGGGNHLTLTKDDAAARSAFVRVRPMNYRADMVAVLKPSYAKIGIP